MIFESSKELLDEIKVRVLRYQEEIYSLDETPKPNVSIGDLYFDLFINGRHQGQVKINFENMFPIQGHGYHDVEEFYKE